MVYMQTPNEVSRQNRSVVAGHSVQPLHRAGMERPARAAVIGPELAHALLPFD